jgi:hypothetical protein
MSSKAPLLSQAEFYTKIGEPSLVLQLYKELSFEWMEELICWWFSIPEPQEWQVRCALQQTENQDVFLTLRTQSGKSLVLHALIIAQYVLRTSLMDRFLTIMCYPTIALMDDQVSFFALHQHNREIRFTSSTCRNRLLNG